MLNRWEQDSSGELRIVVAAYWLPVKRALHPPICGLRHICAERVLTFRSARRYLDKYRHIQHFFGATDCASPQSGSCSENFVTLTDVSGQILRLEQVTDDSNHVIDLLRHLA